MLTPTPAHETPTRSDRAGRATAAAGAQAVKVAWIVLATAVALALQTTLARFVVRGTVAVDLVLVVVVYAALKAGPVTGLLTGTFAGLVQDALSSGVIGIGGLAKTIVGFLAGIVGTQFIVAAVAAPVHRIFRSDNRPRRGIYRVVRAARSAAVRHALFRGDRAGRRECRRRRRGLSAGRAPARRGRAAPGFENASQAVIRKLLVLMLSHEDRRRVGIRLSVLQYVVVALFSVLAVSFWVLQVAQHAKFEEMAENNNQRTIPLRAPRGVVFDRNGHVLVENRHAYSISIVREHTKDLNLTIRLLAQVLRLDPAGVKEIVDRHRREPTYRPIMIIQDATLAQVTAVTAHRLELPDVAHRADPDAAVSRCARGASVRLRRRGERRAGGAGLDAQERRHRRSAGDREGRTTPC